MEIERKYLIPALPKNYAAYPCHVIEQGYLSTDPTIRVRRQDEDYYLTYKSRGLLAREEYNLPLNKEAYQHLLKKTDGHIIAKKRYLLPLEGSDHLMVELDVFEGRFEGLWLAEVEFPNEEEAEEFTPPSWFGEDVTFSGKYQNSYLSLLP